MIWKIVKGVARAAFSRPWDYQGEGAPNDWEFRVSPDEEHIAVYGPLHGRWVIIGSRDGGVVAEVPSLTEMDKHTGDWRQFLSVEDPDD